MKHIFQVMPVNGPFEDPALYVAITHEKRAFLFDAGNLSRLAMGHLFKVTSLFVTHMHIDHFIGFDQLLRALLRSTDPLKVYGPRGIIDAVGSKLGGYAWNLIQSYPIKIEVFEFGCGMLRHASYYAENDFRRIDRPSLPVEGQAADIVYADDLCTVRVLALDHNIPVLAYRLEETYHVNINKVTLAERGLPVGPWLAMLKGLIRRAAPSDTMLCVQGRLFTLGELLPVATITRGQRIAYVTDMAPREENMERLIPFVKGVDILFCEAYFLDKDRDRAQERHHLTAALAGCVAREAGVGKIEITHISPKYTDRPKEIYDEVQREFKREVHAAAIRH